MKHQTVRNQQLAPKQKKTLKKTTKQPTLNIRELIENPAWRHVLEGLGEEQKAQLIQEYERAVQDDQNLSLQRQQKQTVQLQLMQQQQEQLMQIANKERKLSSGKKPKRPQSAKMAAKKKKKQTQARGEIINNYFPMLENQNGINSSHQDSPA